MTHVRDVLDRLEDMEGRCAPWKPLWQDVFDYVLPFHFPSLNARKLPENRAEKRFDATATHLLRRLAATVGALTANPNEDWLGLQAERRGENGWEPIEDEATTRWLDGTIGPYLDELRRSNFYSEYGSFLEELVGPGTGALFLDEERIRGPGFQGFRFRALGAGEFVIDEDDLGRVDTLMRPLNLTARQAKLKFPNASLHANITKALRDRDNNQTFEFIHAVHLRDDPVLGQKTDPADRSNRAMPWVSVYVDKTHETEVERGGFSQQRYFSGRWTRSDGELYGRSPAIDALPDIKSLSTLAKYGLEGLAMHVYPPWLFPDESIIGRLKLTPGAANFYDPESGGDIQALQSKGNFIVEQKKEEALRQAIAQAFMDDVLGLREEGEVTATEVLDRRERRQQVTGPSVTRIIADVLEPGVESGWMMMFRAGEFGRPPDGLLAAERLRAVFLSTLARQQRMAALRSLQDGMAVLTPMFEVRPEMLDHYDFDAIARDVPDDMGVPRKWLTEEDEVEETRRLRAQRQQQQAALAQGMEIAKTAAEVEQAA